MSQQVNAPSDALCYLLNCTMASIQDIADRKRFVLKEIVRLIAASETGLRRLKNADSFLLEAGQPPRTKWGRYDRLLPKEEDFPVLDYFNELRVRNRHSNILSLGEFANHADKYDMHPDRHGRPLVIDAALNVGCHYLIKATLWRLAYLIERKGSLREQERHCLIAHNAIETMKRDQIQVSEEAEAFYSATDRILWASENIAINPA